MPNDSSTGGYLDPAVSPAPLEGQLFDRFIQQVVAAITGLDGTLVRPRWQAEPPNLPPLGTDWCAVGPVGFDADQYANVVHTDGQDAIYRQERVELLLSFYGPDGAEKAARWRDGLSVAQNREVLVLNDMQVQQLGPIRRVPALIAERWQDRYDISTVIVRAVHRVYPVLNLISGSGTLLTDTDPQLTADLDSTA